MRLLLQLPPESRFMTDVEPFNAWQIDRQILSAIEYDMRVLIHSVNFLMADKRHEQKRRESFPKDYMEPTFVSEARKASTEKKEQYEMFSTDYVDSVLSGRRVAVEKPKII